jgi:uncharacterized coiled-coil DUF342 family protein
MFGFVNGVKVFLIILPLIMGGGGYYYINIQKEKIQELKTNQTILKDSVSAKEAEIVRLNENVEEVLSISKEVSGERDRLSSEVNTLRTKLSDHDLGFLAENKPGLVEKIINKDIEKTLKSGVLEIMENEND